MFVASNVEVVTVKLLGYMMTDQAKRKTLKTMAAGGLGAAAGAYGSMAMAAKVLVPEVDDVAALAELTVKVSHSWTAHDVKIEFKNNTQRPITITQITPSRISTQLGDLDFDQFMEEGPITLAPNAQASIGMDSREALQKMGTESGQFAKSLQQTIRQNLSVITDSEAFAAVTMEFDPRLV